MNAEQVVCLTLLVMLCTLSGLIFIWAVKSRGHWLLRLLVVQVYLGLWLLPEAYEILAVLSVQLVTTIIALLLGDLLGTVLREVLVETPHGGHTAERPAKPPRGRLQFSLQNALLAMVPIALALGMATHVAREMSPREATFWSFWRPGLRVMFLKRPLRLMEVPPEFPTPWVSFTLVGLVAGLSSVLAVWIVLGRGRRRLRWLLLLGIPSTWLPALWLGLLRRSGAWRIDVARHSQHEPVAHQEVGVSSGWHGQRGLTTIAAAMVSLGIVMPLATLFCAMARSPAIPRAELSEPNDYDTLLQLGSEVRVAYGLGGAYDLDKESDIPSEWKTFVAEHQEVLQRVHAALDQPCRIPLDYGRSSSTDWLYFHYLAQAFLIEGRVAQSDGDARKAALIYLDAIPLAVAVEKSGRRVCGNMIATSCAGPVYGLRERLSVEDRRLIIARLQAATKKWEPVDDVVHRSRVWCGATMDWAYRLRGFLVEWEQRAGVNTNIFPDHGRSYVVEQDHKRIATLRLLTCTLALENYKAERGVYPDRLDALVPTYVDALPIGLFSDTPMSYRREKSDYVLEDVGIFGYHYGEPEALSWIAEELYRIWEDVDGE